MLKIRANGALLQLPSNVEFNLVIENPFLQTERLPVPYSLSLDIEPTANNLMIFGYPNRLTALKRIELSCEIEFGGIIFLRGLIILMGFDQKIKTTFKGISVFDDLKKKLTDLPLAQYNLGKNQYKNIGTPTRPLMVPKVDRNDVNNIGYKYKNLYKNSLTNNGDFIVAPVRLSTSSWKRYLRDVKYRDRSGMSHEFNINVILPTNTADNFYINYYNPVIQDFNLTRNYVKTASAGGGELTVLSDYVNTRNFPFPTLKYIFDIAFSNVLTANPFNESELNKLVLVTCYHPNWKAVEGYMQDMTLEAMLMDKYFQRGDEQDHMISLNKFMPDYGVNDLLKSIMKIFCFSGFVVGGKIGIKKNADVLNSTKRIDWNSKLIGKPSIGVRNAMFYKYGYSNIKDESIEGLTITNVATVADMHLSNLELSNGFTGFYKITSTGEIYKKEYVETELVYTRLKAGLGGSADETEDTFDMTSNAEPLAMTVAPYWTALPENNEQPPYKFWYVPEMEDKRGSRGSDINIMFYRGMKSTFETGEQYPSLYAKNIDQFGNKLGEYSLDWDGEDGLIENFHKEYKQWIETDKVRFSQAVLLSAKDLKELDMSTKVSVSGGLYFVEKIQVTIGLNTIKPALVDFVEA